MTHWRTSPHSWACCNGHAYSHPKQSQMSVYFGGGSCLTVFLACHRCNPVTYQMGVVYDVKPLPMVYWYGCETKADFDRAKQMDEQEAPLFGILDFLTQARAA